MKKAFLIIISILCAQPAIAVPNEPYEDSDMTWAPKNCLLLGWFNSERGRPNGLHVRLSWLVQQ
jgi:hypothetical protein